MKLSGGVEWALHCRVVLTTASAPVPAARLAEPHDVSGSDLAKQLQALSRAGPVNSVQGKAGGYVLTRSPELISGWLAGPDDGSGDSGGPAAGR